MLTDDTCENCGGPLDEDGACLDEDCGEGEDDDCNGSSDCEEEYDDRGAYDAGDWGQPGDGRYWP